MSAERQILFTARQDGYFQYRVPGIVCTAGATLVVAVEGRRDTRGGHAEAHGDYRDQDILIRRSLDGGHTWQPRQLVLSHRDFGPGPLHNCMLIPDRTGRLHALVLHDYRTMMYLASADEGATWSLPADVTTVMEGFREEYSWQAIGTGCGHGIQLRSGRLLVPVWLSDNSHSPHRPSVVATIYSDDNGATWQRGEIVCRTTPRYRWPSESMVAELPDGRVMINMRSESDERRRLVALSPDGISRWSMPKFAAQLLEPVCEGAMIGLSGQNVLAFTNPDSLDQSLPGSGGNKADRKNLTLKLSFDQGETWPVSHVIEPGPSAYSDLCARPDGMLIVAFECGMASANMHDSAMIAVERIPVTHWLKGA